MITPWILVFTFFLTAAWVFPVRKLLPKEISGSKTGMTAFFVAAWLATAYAGTKPDPPPPPPPPPFGPTNAVVIPTAREIDGGVWLFWPSGKFKYWKEVGR